MDCGKMKETSLLPNIISKLQIRISLLQLISWNGIVSLIVFIVTQKNFATWPMIDLIPHLQRLENDNSTFTKADYFSSSQLSHSGRGPFVFISHIILLISRISPETYLAFSSSALVAIGPTIVMITFIQTRKTIALGQRFFTILDCLVLIFNAIFFSALCSSIGFSWIFLNYFYSGHGASNVEYNFNCSRDNWLYKYKKHFAQVCIYGRTLPGHSHTPSNFTYVFDFLGTIENGS
jgi:hypothetical protein